MIRSFNDDISHIMATVYSFAALGRFKSLSEMRRFIEQTYTEDGDGIGRCSYRAFQLWAKLIQQFVSLSRTLFFI
jgi:hypothetical protein